MKDKGGIGDRNQYLLYNHKDLGLDPGTHVKSQA